MSSARPTGKCRFNTIGARLTLWGAVVTFGVCAALCAVLYAGVFFSLRDEIDTFIEGEVYEFLGGANEHDGGDSTWQDEIRQELGARSSGDLAFRLYDTQGQLLITSELNDRLAIHWLPKKDPPHEPIFETLSPPGSRTSFRLCSLWTTLGDGRACIAQAGYSMERMKASLAGFRRICGIALLLSVGASVVVGRFLAVRSLRPMRLIAADAKGINPERLDQRFSTTGTGDELDQLVTAFNGLLGRTERYVTQLRQFTADASHELRTPLTALRGMTEVALSNERSADGLRHVLEENISHFDRLQRIAEDLLLLTRLDAGECVLQRDTVELKRVIHNVVDLYRPVAEERGVDLSAGESPAVTIVADGARIKQVVCNLVDNAVKYTLAKGSVCVSVSMNENAAQIMIEDTGLGISAESLPRVFDRFYRADQARSSENGAGAGLGLSICRSITEAHNGEIRIHSKLGTGTTVTMTLPLDAQS